MSESFQPFNQEDTLRRDGEEEPTIGRIDVASFDPQEKPRVWVNQAVPAFVGSLLVAL